VTALRDETTEARALRGLFGRDSVYLLVWALQLVIAAGVTPVVTRLMPTSEFGLVAAANAVMQVLFILAGLGLRMAIQRHYARVDGPAQAARLLMLTVLTAGLMTALADGTGPLWSGYLGFDSYGGPLRLAVFWAGVSAVTNASLALLRSQDRLLAFSSVSLLQSVIAEATSLVLVAVVSPTATMFVLGQLVLQVAAALLGLVLAPPKLLRVSDRELARTALGYALPLVPAVLCTFILVASDRLIVQAYLGSTAVARYQIAYNIGAMPIILLNVLSNAWMPRFFGLGRATERAAVVAASRDALHRLVVPVVVGLSAGSPLLLRLWAPAKYRPDDLLLVTALVIVSTIPYAAGLSSTRALLTEGRTAAIAGANGVAAAANIVLNLILVPRYQLVGAAVATFLAYVVLHQILLVAAGAVLPTPRTSVRRLAELVIAALVALLASALPPGGPYLVIRLVLAAACVLWFGRVLFRLNGRMA
jgi:O-antigen/teichoic acid export membrane protein